jgi:tetratricopeptide (TPR) repeat protein
LFLVVFLLTKNFYMKKIITICSMFLAMYSLSIAQLTTPPDGGNKKAWAGERIGLTDVSIHYDRPAVKGREGKIWGALVPFGFNDLGFGTSKASPWRAGANENTTIKFSTDVMVEGKPLEAGKYGFFVAVDKDQSTIIFSKNTNSWGSYFYNAKDDALRVTIKQQQLDKPVERLKYEFMDQTDNSATLALQWEKWSFPFKIETDLTKNQLESFRNELTSDKGFDWKAWAQAAEWCAANKTNLDEGLTWADYGISGAFIGEKNFRTLSAKSQILKLQGKETEAMALMNEAMPLGNINEIHGYARQLLTAGKIKEAADAFKSNYKKFPNVFTTNMGMARALSSEGKFKEALKYANSGLAQAPDAANKANAESFIEKLKAGKDINQ